MGGLYGSIIYLNKLFLLNICGLLDTVITLIPPLPSYGFGALRAG